MLVAAEAARRAFATHSLSHGLGSFVIRLLAVVGLWVSLSWLAAAQTPDLVEFSLGGRWERGLQLIHLDTEAVVIGQDGRLHSLDSSDSSHQIRPALGRYEPLSAAAMRNQLRSEFGPRFEVVSTNNFLVVQPRGRGPKWPTMFETCHQSFTNYMRKRGVRIREGRFPMVAVVLPDSAAMYAEFDRHGIEVARVAGLYSNNTNRVMTHDSGHFRQIELTVRHEAAHQSAFNSGVHSRVNETPQWITEGIGQMFEPAAMSNGKSGYRLSDRVNAESLRLINRRHGPSGNPELVDDIRQLVRDDLLFQSSDRIEDAYAVAWAMMFFLAERQPDVFADLINFTATRPPFQLYQNGQRVIDFERIAGVSTEDFAQQLSWFLDSLR